MGYKGNTTDSMDGFLKGFSDEFEVKGVVEQADTLPGKYGRDVDGMDGICEVEKAKKPGKGVKDGDKRFELERDLDPIKRAAEEDTESGITADKQTSRKGFEAWNQMVEKGVFLDPNTIHMSRDNVHEALGDIIDVANSGYNDVAAKETGRWIAKELSDNIETKTVIPGPGTQVGAIEAAGRQGAFEAGRLGSKVKNAAKTVIESAKNNPKRAAALLLAAPAGMAAKYGVSRALGSNEDKGFGQLEVKELSNSIEMKANAAELAGEARAIREAGSAPMAGTAPIRKYQEKRQLAKVNAANQERNLAEKTKTGNMELAGGAKTPAQEAAQVNKVKPALPSQMAKQEAGRGIGEKILGTPTGIQDKVIRAGDVAAGNKTSAIKRAAGKVAGFAGRNPLATAAGVAAGVGAGYGGYRALSNEDKGFDDIEEKCIGSKKPFAKSGAPIEKCDPAPVRKEFDLADQLNEQFGPKKK
jgi:hypothetical protein